ncbi:MAG: hypothetical protein ACREU1_05805, partial [Burkholderiales bacterium]
ARPGDARAPKAASLVPADLAMGYLQGIKSEAGRSLLTGETTIAPCRFTEKGLWSGGEYNRLIGRRAPNQVTAYTHWVLFKIEDPAGRDIVPADLGREGAWNYSVRTPRTARTVFGTTDHCIIGPTAEPARKVVEALAALGVEVAAEFTYMLAN